jgi:hypothetical protein
MTRRAWVPCVPHRVRPQPQPRQPTEQGELPVQQGTRLGLDKVGNEPISGTRAPGSVENEGLSLGASPLSPPYFGYGLQRVLL